MISNKRKRRDRSPSLSSDSKENIDLDDEDDDDAQLLNAANDSDDSLDMDLSPTIESNNFQNTQDNSNYIECGVVKSLKLVNFMCHAHFSIDFGPRINFVIGRNGSGKSAILTAIVLALGGRSNHTSRGQSLKSFIKTGETRSKIVVKLNNFNGVDRSSSFKYDVYGDTIWVERILKSDGSSTYSLKSKSGQLITHLKKELDCIVKHFNIQIDNPIVVLNQEVSRNFLNSKNPKDKYNFFMKATQLEDILHDYAHAAEKTSLTEIELDKKKALLKEVAAELSELQKKVAILEKLDGENSKLSLLDDELLWAMVKEKEAELDKLKIEIENHHRKIESDNASIDKLEKKYEKFTSEREEISQELDNSGIKVNEFKVKIEEKNKTISELKEKKNGFSIEVAKIKIELENMREDEKVLEKKISELKKQFGDLDKVERTRQIKAEQIAKLEEENSQLQAEIRTRKLHKEQLQGSIIEMDKKIHGMKNEIESIKMAISKAKQNISQALSSEHNKLMRFGAHMPNILKNIDMAHREGRFRHKPLGPIGHLIKLRDPNAALAVESCIKGLVNAFCCDNQDDAIVLNDIFKRIPSNLRPPMIITRRFTRLHDVSANCIRSDKYNSILDLLEIDQAPVANVLIDRSNIESIVYIANEQEALDIMTNADKVPYNCNQAYTRSGTNMYPIKKNQFFKSYAPNYNQAKYLSHDLSAYVNSLENEAIELSKKWDAKTKELAPIEQNLRENKSDLEETNSKIRRMHDRLNEVTRELEEWRNTEEPTPVEISILEEELDNIRAEKKSKTERLSELLGKYNEIKKSIDEISTEANVLQEEKTNICHEERPLKEKMKNLDDSLTSVHRNLHRFKENLSTLGLELEQLKSLENELEKQVAAMRQKALKKTKKEVRTARASADVKREITDIKEVLEKQAKEIGDRDKITKQYKDRIVAHDRVTEQVKTFEELLEEFKVSTKMRLDKYRRLRKQITEKACQVFKLALDALNFSGILEIIHDDCVIDGAQKKAKTLEIKINPKVMVNSDVYKDTRSLSGGERSYGTVAFLVSLWESCNSPFRILDEVDVFMDVVTRSTAMQVLVENAKMKHGKQYIFLSPLGLVVGEQFVSVHEMPNPIRGISSNNVSED